MFYNYPAALIAGNKHPQMMGQLYRIAWGELWDGLKPSVEAVFEKGQVLHQVNAKFFIQRNEFLEESAFTYTYVPCRDEDGKIAGCVLIGTASPQGLGQGSQAEPMTAPAWADTICTQVLQSILRDDSSSHC